MPSRTGIERVAASQPGTTNHDARAVAAAATSVEGARSAALSVSGVATSQARIGSPSTSKKLRTTLTAKPNAAGIAAAGAAASGSVSPVNAEANPTKTDSPAKVAVTGAALAATSAATTGSGASATVTSTGAITPAPKPTLLGVVSGLIFGVFTELERLLTGPPTVPAGSNVTVRSSSLQVAGGVVVPADWYYPAGDPPQRMILLQHGFFAIGAMCSDTAATLAAKTDSIVVVPTLTSNPFADGGLWVNGVGMQQAVARLFVGDRAALTASALAAGYAKQYGLTAADALLPKEFVLAGHSAGGALVSGTAGYLADDGAANDLAGVLLLDAVTTGTELSAALTKLNTYQQQTGRYIPVQEIGSPPNLWNFISNVNSTLTHARPDHFDGVVLSGGVHTDSMGGGSSISEFLVHLLAGFPTASNPSALRQLSVQWVNDWFDGNTEADDDLQPGSTITISTPNGTAVGKVIGTPVPAGASVAVVPADGR